MHRHVFRKHGGVTGFVNAHSSVFAVEPAGPGEKCQSIRLLTPAERRIAVASAAAAEAAKGIKTLCKFHQFGKCLKGEKCSYSHDLLAAVPLAEGSFCTGDQLSFNSTIFDSGLPGEGERTEAIRAQVIFYLSDCNLRTDAFFQGIMAKSEGGWIPVSDILGCRRMQQMKATTQEVLDCLRADATALNSWLELREVPDGAEAVRRICPPPPLQEERHPEPPEKPEPTLEEQPLELLRHRGTGWQAIVDDHVRRSFMYFRRSTWPAELLMQEFQAIEANTRWIVLRSKPGMVTRSTAWCVRRGCCCRYVYGDVSVEPQPRPAWLADVEARVLGEGCGLDPSEWPNGVNMNLYENEDQNVGWHSDDEGLFRGCEQDCRIISASWGESRKFEVALKDFQHESGRPSIYKESIRSITLEAGDLCSMEGLFQRHYSHQIAKGPSAFEQIPPSLKRINLTWRYIVQHKPYCPMSKQR